MTKDTGHGFNRSRRTLLKGALLSGSLAGCLDGGGEEQTPTDGSNFGDPHSAEDSGIIYQDGNEFFEFTPATNAGKTDYRKGEESLVLEVEINDETVGGEIALVTEEKVDLTEFEIIRLDWANDGDHPSQIRQYAGVAQQRDQINRAAIEADQWAAGLYRGPESSVSRVEESFDVSELDGEYYVGVGTELSSDTPGSSVATVYGIVGGVPTPTPTPTEAPPAADGPMVSGSQALADVFSESPSSAHAPGDGGVSLEWLTDNTFEIVKVTNLDGTGHGSLRWALNQTGPRIVVFEVGGVIDLQGRSLTVESEGSHGNVIVAGQTAPDPGITVIRDGVRIYAQNVICQHLRFRPGDDTLSMKEEGLTEPDFSKAESQTEGFSSDALNPGGSTHRGNQIIDHCSVTWGTDEGLSVVERDRADAGIGNRAPIQVSNTIIADTLANSALHGESGHNLGSLLYTGFEYHFVGNLYANVKTRVPWIGAYGGCDAVVANTLVHNAEDGKMHSGIEHNGKMRVALIGNGFSLTEGGFKLVITRDDTQKPKKLYMADNGYTKTEPTGPWDIVDEPPVSLHDIDPLDRGELESHHAETVGARPAQRTPLDERQIRQLEEGTGEWIDSQEEVGGYPDFDTVERELDVPTAAEDFAEWLAQHTRAVEVQAADPPS